MRDRLTRWYHHSVLFEIRNRLRAARQSPMPRSCRTYIVDVQTHAIQPDAAMETYWVEAPVGPGPGASVYICDEEVMRFDCFGGNRGHFHFNLRQSRYVPSGELIRIYYPDGSVHDHIDRAAFDLRRNLDYARGMNLSGKVRAFHIDQAALNKASETLRCCLREIADRHCATA